MSTKKPSWNSEVEIWMPLYIGDHLKETITLSPAEEGAYLRLQMYYWGHGPLTDDDTKLAKIVRIGSDEWKSLRPELVSQFEIRGDKWHHAGLDRLRVEAVANWKKQHDRTKRATEALRKKREESGATNRTDDDRNDDRAGINDPGRDDFRDDDRNDDCAGINDPGRDDFRDDDRNDDRNDARAGINDPGRDDFRDDDRNDLHRAVEGEGEGEGDVADRGNDEADWVLENEIEDQLARDLDE